MSRSHLRAPIRGQSAFCTGYVVFSSLTDVPIIRPIIFCWQKPSNLILFTAASAKPPSWYASFELLHIVSLTFPRKNLYFADMKARSKDQRCVALGLTIKKLREQKKLTQEQLAEKADIHTSYIGQIERGMRYPSLKILFKIADALNAKIIDLFKEV